MALKAESDWHWQRFASCEPLAATPGVDGVGSVGKTELVWSWMIKTPVSYFHQHSRRRTVTYTAIAMSNDPEISRIDPQWSPKQCGISRPGSQLNLQLSITKFGRSWMVQNDPVSTQIGQKRSLNVCNSIKTSPNCTSRYPEPNLDDPEWSKTILNGTKRS